MASDNKIGNILVYNSITNDIDDVKNDVSSAFSYVNWLKHIKIKNVDINNTLIFYTNYLKQWNDLSTTKSTDIIRDKYVELLKEIALNYSNPEEKRYLSNIDLTNTTEVKIAVPFFARKIKQICQNIIKQRDNIRSTNKKTGTGGSIGQIESDISQLIVNDIITLSSSSKDKVLSSNITVDIESLYEIDRPYFNNNDENFYDSFPIDSFPNGFMTNDEYLEFKNELINSESLDYHKKHLDSDYYSLVVTNKQKREYSIEKLIEGRGKSADNISNQIYDPIAVKPNDSLLVPVEYIGDYFTPKYLGVLYYNSFSLDYTIDFDKVEEGRYYVFPDPEKIQTSLYNDEEVPLIWFDNISAIKSDVTQCEKYGYILDKVFYNCFYGYQSKQQTLDYSVFGVNNTTADYNFWTGDLNNIFKGNSIYGIQDIESMESRIIKTDSNIEYYQEDIFGNMFALYKNTGSSTYSETSHKSLLNIIGGDYDNVLSTGTFAPDLSSSEYNIATNQSVDGVNFGYYYIFASDVDDDKYKIIRNSETTLPFGTDILLSTEPQLPINYDLYDTRFNMGSDELYFKSNAGKYIGKFFELFSFYQTRYGQYYDEIKNNLKRIDVFSDIIIYTCEHFILIDKIKYDYINQEMIDPGTQFYSLENYGIYQYSVPFYDENDHNIYIGSIHANDDVLSSTADKIILSDIYTINIDDFKLSKRIKESMDLSDYVMLNDEGRSKFDIVTIDKPCICKKNDRISITFTASDKTGYKILFNHEYLFRGNLILNEIDYYFNDDIYINTTNNGITVPLSSYNLSSFEYLSVDGNPLAGNNPISITQNLILFN